MLKLPQVTLVALSGIDYQTKENIEALKKSCEGIEWGAVKYIQQASITSIDSWNEAIIYDLPKYIDTEFAFLAHSDGYPKNPGCWREDFLLYDYIGAPWPLPMDPYSYRDESGGLVRVGNSVSIRSKKLMDLIAQTPREYFRSFKEKYGNTNEDGYICCHNRQYLESRGIKFAPLEIAKYFSKEHEIPENQGIETFAFHSL